MKKCPYCHGDLQEHATFCLHCMHSLDQKTAIIPRKKRGIWKPAVLVLAAVLGIAIGGILASYKPAPKSPPQVAGTEKPPTEPPAATASGPTVKPTEPVVTNPTTPTQPPATNPPEPTDPPETEPAIPSIPPEDIFIFRKAQRSDYLQPTNEMTAWDIVITGVKVKQDVYFIPDSIFDRYGGENRVAGIAAGAFEGSGAKVIYTSPYLFFIHEDAFKGCHLTDLYLSSVYYVDMHPNAYASLETLHTPYSTTVDKVFNVTMPFRKISQAVYKAEWDEWIFAQLEKEMPE